MIEQRFRERYGGQLLMLMRMDSARGRAAAGYLTCLPRCNSTTVPDAGFCMATRLRLGAPGAPNLPERCACGEPLSDCYTHLLACKRLCILRPAQLEGGQPGVRNAWDMRHRMVLEQISADLVQAGVGVVMEPGVIDPRPAQRLGDGLPMPDQLITYVATKSNGVPQRIATDVSITEAVTRSNADVRKYPHVSLDERVREKDAVHRDAARAAGCEFVPLVFTSLGRMHARTEQFLGLNDFSLDERLLQRISGGRRQFVARSIDGVSCSLARGNARMLFFVCGELARISAQRAPPDRDGHGNWAGLVP